MIAQLRGILLLKSSTEIVVDCNGVGYSAFVSINTSDNLPGQGEEVQIYTLLIPKEDALQLYAFSTIAEREAFKQLISISGIGPKTSLGILSSVSVESLQEYILSGNLVALAKLPGIGKKTAERIVLELRDKILKLGEFVPQTTDTKQRLIKQEAVSALITLGYSQSIAEKAVRKVLSEDETKDISAEKLIKKALRYTIL